MARRGAEHWGIKTAPRRRREHEQNIRMREANLLSLSYGRIVPKDINSNDGLLPEVSRPTKSFNRKTWLAD